MHALSLNCFFLQTDLFLSTCQCHLASKTEITLVVVHSNRGSQLFLSFLGGGLIFNFYFYFFAVNMFLEGSIKMGRGGLSKIFILIFLFFLAVKMF